MIKWTFIITLLVIISYFHIQESRTELESHLLHQQLFFIPIILASFWFRLRAGLCVAVIASTIYSSALLIHMNNPGIQITLISQISLYLFVAALIGSLTSRLDKQQKNALKEEKERSVITLVSALSYEILDIINALEIKHTKKETALDNNGNRDFQQEISKLKQLKKAFDQFAPSIDHKSISLDLNEVLRKSRRKLQAKAKKANIDINAELDDTGCPSMVLNDAIIRLLEALIDNAIEASPKGSEIIIRSRRKGTHCQVEVIDNGHGVNEADVPYLFTPFFTTKPGGHGLSLAAGKKIMKDCEGDLIYERREKSGSIFKLIIPRENTDKNIAGHISERVRK